MKVTLINGSPRGKGSNTKLLLDNFINGLKVNTNCETEIFYLNSKKDKDLALEALKNSEYAILAYPLYTDAMPGIVMEFIEKLKILKRQLPNLKLGFIVQSGFPEAYHSTFVEKYHNKLTKRLEVQYLGTIIKGGVEGIAIQPGWMTKKLFTKFYELGIYFGTHGQFNPEIKKALRKRMHLPKNSKFFFNLMKKSGMMDKYWNMQLKKNNAFRDRFVKPYQK